VQATPQTMKPKMISSNNGDPMKSSPKTRKSSSRSGSSSIFMTLEIDPSPKLTIPSVQSDASFSDTLRQRVKYNRRYSLDGDDGVNGSRNHVNGLRPHEQLRRHSADLLKSRRSSNLQRRHSATLPRIPQSSLIKAVSTPDLASKSIFAIGRRVNIRDFSRSPEKVRRRTLDYSWKPEGESAFSFASTVATDTDNSDDHKALDPTAWRYLPKILRDTYAQRQTKRPSIVRRLNFFSDYILKDSKRS
jgi:hypothetical protein